MKRREFITLLGGAAAACRSVAHAQERQRLRRVAILMGGPPESDPDSQRQYDAFRRALAATGWVAGQNVQFETRWPGTSYQRIGELARELVGLAPDVILSRTTPSTIALKAQTRTIPIVFAVVTEPVASGLVESFAPPGGNITGFTNLEASMGGKLIELLKEAVPRTIRIAALFNPTTAPYAGSILGAARAAAESHAIELIPSPVSNAAEIEAAIASLSRRPGGGLMGIQDGFLNSSRDVIIANAARHRMPAIYATLSFAEHGGLMSYGVDNTDLLRRAAWTASFAARALASCRFSSPPSSCLRSISRPPRRSGSTCRRRCSPAPTR